MRTRTTTFLKPSNLRISNRTIKQFKSRLQPGDVIKGRVIGQFENNKALIGFRGYNIVAEIPAQLDKGEIIDVRILEVGDKIVMRLLRPDSNTPVRFTATITDILNDMGVPANEKTNAIVKALVQYDIPLTAENIQSVLNYSSAIAGEFDQSIDLLLLAWFLNLPPNPRILENLKLFNSIRTPLGDQLSKLKALLPELIAQDKSVDSDIAKDLIDVLDQLTLFPNKGNIETQIRQLLENLGLEYEQALLAAAQEENVNVLQDLKWLNQTLKGMLLRLHGQLMDGMDTRSSIVERVLKLIDGILQNFEVQEMTQGNIRELPQFYLQIPYLVDGNIATLEFMSRKLNEDGDGEGFDPNNTLHSFLVSTANLGNIKINLNIYQEKTSCVILMENESARDFVDQYKYELVDRLEKLDYPVQSIHCRTAPNEAKLELLNEPPELVGDVVKIDVTA